jgi:hypothetical protein
VNISATGKLMCDLIKTAIEDGTTWCPWWLQFPARHATPLEPSSWGTTIGYDGAEIGHVL